MMGKFKQYIFLSILGLLPFLNAVAEQPSLDQDKIDSLNRSFSDSNYLKYAIGFLSGGLFIAFIWFLTSRSRKKTKVYKKSMSLSLGKNEEMWSDSLNDESNKTYKLQQTIDDLKRQIREKDDIKKKSEATIEELNGMIYELQNPTKDSEVSITENFMEKSSYLFFSSPLPDGSFKLIDGRATFLEGASVYKFKLLSDIEAEFEFCEESSSVGMALNNRTDLILSVSEEMEGNPYDAKKILTYRGGIGKAILKDNKWIVMNKVKIKYV